MKWHAPTIGLCVPELKRALMVLLPTLVLAALTKDAIWLQASVMTMATFVAQERTSLAPMGVLAHSLAILAALTVLLLAHSSNVLFVFAVVALAIACIRLTVLGAKLRTLGSFTFVPALYLSMELSSPGADGRLQQLSTLLPLLLAGCVPTIILSAAMHAGRISNETSVLAHHLRLFSSLDHGERQESWLVVASMALAVLAAAALVAVLHAKDGQWMIWSAATVVTGEVAGSRNKLYQRCLGALFGVPIGFGMGLLVPVSPLLHSICLIISLLTLVALRNYVFSFGARCMFIALAAALIGEGSSVSVARAADVVIGGCFGLISVAFLNQTYKLFAAARNGQQALSHHGHRQTH